MNDVELKAYRFDRINQRVGHELTIFDFYTAVQADSDAKRAARDTSLSDEARRAAKQQTPAWFFGGFLYNGEIKSDNVFAQGVLNIDIDDVDGERVDVLKSRLFALSSVFLAARSVSGRGVFALARVDLDTQQDQILAERFYQLIEAVVLYDAAEHPGEHLDHACKDLARRRFETYDPAPLFDASKCGDASAYCADLAAQGARAFSRSAVIRLASLFGSRKAPEPAGATTGCALALLNVAAGGRVAGRVFTEEYYKARMQAVVIGRSGAGKSTLRDALREAAGTLNATTGVVESARALEVMLVRASLAEREGVDKKAQDRDRYLQIEPPTPILAIYDEAGDEAQQRRTKEHKAGIDSIRRRTFDRTFGAATSLNTQLPQMDFFCSYTDVQFTTPKSWAKAKQSADVTVGDARRVLEFWTDDEPLATPGGADPVLARWGQRYMQVKPAADTAAITAFVAALSMAVPDTDAEQVAVRLDGRDTYMLENLQGVAELARRGESEQAIEDHTTVISNLATICAWAGQHARIERDDVLTAWAIYMGVLDNRRRLGEFAPLGPETIGAQITESILDYIGAREPYYSTVKRAISKRGAEFTRALEGLLSDGVLVFSGTTKSRTIRRATDAEIAEREAVKESRAVAVMAAEAKRQATQAAPATSNVAIQRIEHSAAGTKPAPKTYAECTDAEKIERLEKYRASFETKHGHLIEIGNADNALFCLFSQLGKAGMNDYVAQAWARAICAEIGHTLEKDQNRVMRKMLNPGDEKKVNLS